MNTSEDEKVVSLVKHIEHKINVRPIEGSFNHVNEYKNDGPLLFERAMAFTIDLVFIGATKFFVTVTFSSFVASIAGLGIKSIESLSTPPASVEWSVSSLLFFSYFIFCNYVGNGKTIGNRVFKISSIENNYLSDFPNKDFHPTLRHSVLMTLGAYLGFISFGVLFLLPFIRKDQRSLAAILSNTTTISDKGLYEVFLAKNRSQEVLKVEVTAQAA